MIDRAQRAIGVPKEQLVPGTNASSAKNEVSLLLRELRRRRRHHVVPRPPRVTFAALCLQRTPGRRPHGRLLRRRFLIHPAKYLPRRPGPLPGVSGLLCERMRPNAVLSWPTDPASCDGGAAVGPVHRDLATEVKIESGGVDRACARCEVDGARRTARRSSSTSPAASMTTSRPATSPSPKSTSPPSCSSTCSAAPPSPATSTTSESRPTTRSRSIRSEALGLRLRDEDGDHRQPLQPRQRTSDGDAAPATSVVDAIGFVEMGLADRILESSGASS